MYYGSLFLFFAERYEKAREYADRMLKMKTDFIDGLALKGWIELSSGKDSKTKNVMEYFSEVIEQYV